MKPPLAVPHRPDEITRDWLEQALAREVCECRRIELAGSWSSHVRLDIRGAADDAPLLLRAKIASATTFGRAEVDYYLRDFADLADAPLVRCHHAAADDTHYVLLLDDLTETHENRFDITPTADYGLALTGAVARLHAHRWPQPPPDPQSIDRALAPARAGRAALLEAMTEAFTAAERETVTTLLDELPSRLYARLAEQNGFTWIHGDLNPGNILTPVSADAPVLLIDHQPFADSSLTRWLGVGDLAHALVVWWPTDQRRAHERAIVEAWHTALVSRGVRDYSLARAWDDYRLCAMQGINVPADWCSQPGNITKMRWLWEAQLRRVLAAAADLR